MEGHLMGLEKGQYLYGKELVSTGANASSDLENHPLWFCRGVRTGNEFSFIFLGGRTVGECFPSSLVVPTGCLRKLFVQVTLKCGQLTPIPGDCERTWLRHTFNNHPVQTPQPRPTALHTQLLMCLPLTTKTRWELTGYLALVTDNI